MPDLGSQVLETAIGLAFIYFLLSLVVSALTDALAWFLGRRAKNLENGLRTLLSDETALNSVLEHPLIKTLNKPPVSAKLKSLPFGKARRAPSYLPSRSFALALLDTVAPPRDEPGKDQIAVIRDQLNDLPEGLRKQLLPLIDDGAHTRNEIRKSVERWFDDGMERVSGWYRRWAQLVTLVVALVVTLAMNVDSARIADRLWNDDTLRQRVLVQATEFAASDQSAVPEGEAEAEPVPGAEPDSSEAGRDLATIADDADAALGKVEALQLPIGWASANETVGLSTLGGWLITFLAISLGAPFWFDALRRLAQLRTTGSKPAAGSGR